LNWTASTSIVAGYNVYRGTQMGGAYQKINASLQSLLGFTDSAISSGQTYFYVITDLDASGNENAFSNEATAAIP
jgi:fibronectin type 3 domain-containing protein